jgi:hypothetical protein
VKHNNRNTRHVTEVEEKKSRNAFEVLAELSGHVVAGVVLFMAIGLATAALTWFVTFLSCHGITGPVLVTLEGLEHLLFVGDALLFIVWILASGIKALKELISES